MSLLDSLLNRNPTQDWRGQSGLTLVLDLDEESFCGIRLGEKAERLQKLGPAEDAAKARIGTYRYTSHGYYCEEEQGRFAEVVLWYGAALEGQSFSGAVRRNGVAVVFGPGRRKPRSWRTWGLPKSASPRKRRRGSPAEPR